MYIVCLFVCLCVWGKGGREGIFLMFYCYTYIREHILYIYIYIYIYMLFFACKQICWVIFKVSVWGNNYKERYLNVHTCMHACVMHTLVLFPVRDILRLRGGWQVSQDRLSGKSDFECTNSDTHWFIFVSPSNKDAECLISFSFSFSSSYFFWFLVWKRVSVCFNRGGGLIFSLVDPFWLVLIQRLLLLLLLDDTINSMYNICTCKYALHTSISSFFVSGHNGLMLASYLEKYQQLAQSCRIT